MSIQTHEIPILEFDPNPTAILEPTHEKLPLRLPRKCVFAFLGERIEEYARLRGLEPVSWFVSATKCYPIFVTEHKGEKITLCQAPAGAAPAAQLMDWLWGAGNHFRRNLRRAETF